MSLYQSKRSSHQYFRDSMYNLVDILKKFEFLSFDIIDWIYST